MAIHTTKKDVRTQRVTEDNIIVDDVNGKGVKKTLRDKDVLDAIAIHTTVLS